MLHYSGKHRSIRRLTLAWLKVDKLHDRQQLSCISRILITTCSVKMINFWVGHEYHPYYTDNVGEVWRHERR